MMKRFFTSWMLLCILLPLWAQAPEGYYSPAKGSKGAGLKTALHQIIADHTERTYKDLWTDMQKTDVRDDGCVWDMYSATTNYTFVSDQCGNYTYEGDCYNREHSFPKSWFNDAEPMYTDLFHLYPTDGKVNGMRGNNPFGETDGESYQSAEGFSKLGRSTTNGYSGTVFEPADEYKGDFARAYFYMATCYEDRIASWKSDMLAGNSYPAYARWALDMLLRWAAQDPVSPKEVARNNAVYNIQYNRNPFIDYPGLEQYVWGDKTGVAFDPDNYEDGTVTPPPAKDVANPTFNPAPGSVNKGVTVTVSTATPNAYIVYSLNGGNLRTEESPVYVTINETTAIEAYAMLNDKTSETVGATYTLINTDPDEGIQTFRNVNSVAELTVGDRYLIVCESESTAMGVAGNGIRNSCHVTVAGNEIRTETDGEGLPYQMILGETAGEYTLYDATAKTYLSLTSDKNNLHASATAEDETAQWTITFENGTARLINKHYNERSICYNSLNPRFACYKASSGQKSVSLYVNTTHGSGIPSVSPDGRTPVDVYTLDGRRVRKNVPADKALQGLKKGMYVIKGNKVTVK